MFYLKQPAIPAAIKARFALLYRMLDNKYYMDWFNEQVLAAGARLLGTGLWKGGDVGVIDGVIVNGSARAVGGIAAVIAPRADRLPVLVRAGDDPRRVRADDLAAVAATSTTC